LENTSPAPIAATRADAGHCHQPLAGGILRGERVNLGGQAFDALVQPVPVAGQILDDP
jgi:hypothetical protein